MARSADSVADGIRSSDNNSGSMIGGLVNSLVGAIQNLSIAIVGGADDESDGGEGARGGRGERSSYHNSNNNPTKRSNKQELNLNAMPIASCSGVILHLFVSSSQVEFAYANLAHVSLLSRCIL